MRRSAPSSHRHGYLAWTRTHRHTLCILAGSLWSHMCVCVIVHVSEVGQQRCYLTHPVKTSGEFEQAWLLLPTHTHTPCTCRPPHTHAHTHTQHAHAGHHTHMHTHTHNMHMQATTHKYLSEIPVTHKQKAESRPHTCACAYMTKL